MQGKKKTTWVLHLPRWCIKSVPHRGPCCALSAQIAALTDPCIGLSVLLITWKPHNLIKGRFLSNICYLCRRLTFCIWIHTHTSAKLEQINHRLSCVYTVNSDCPFGWFSVLCRSAGLSNVAWYRSNTLAPLQLTFTFLLSGKNHKYAVFDVFPARSAESGQVQVSLAFLDESFPFRLQWDWKDDLFFNGGLWMYCWKLAMSPAQKVDTAPTAAQFAPKYWSLA